LTGNHKNPQPQDAGEVKDKFIHNANPRRFLKKRGRHRCDRLGKLEIRFFLRSKKMQLLIGFGNLSDVEQQLFLDLRKQYVIYGRPRCKMQPSVLKDAVC
jgi:hypothetical protein